MDNLLEIDLDSCAMTTRLSLPRVQSLTSCLRHFIAGRAVTVSLCLRLLGLMVAASPVIRLGLLHMRPFSVVDEKPKHFTPLFSALYDFGDTEVCYVDKTMDVS